MGDRALRPHRRSRIAGALRAPSVGDRPWAARNVGHVHGTLLHPLGAPTLAGDVSSVLEEISRLGVFAFGPLPVEDVGGAHRTNGTAHGRGERRESPRSE